MDGLREICFDTETTGFHARGDDRITEIGCIELAVPDHRFTDTLQIAREKFPGSPASLDALCKRFGVSLSARDKHGAIIDISAAFAALRLQFLRTRPMIGMSLSSRFRMTAMSSKS